MKLALTLNVKIGTKNRTGESLGGQNPVYIYGKMDGDNSITDHAMIIMAIWIDKLPFA